MTRFLIALLAGAVLPAPMLFAEDDAAFGNPVPDAELSEMRGGFLLPNGIDVSLVVRTETSVDGALVLRSVFSANQGPSSLQVFAPRQGETVAAVRGEAATGTAGGAGGVSVQFDRQNGAVLVATGGMNAPSVSVTMGSAGWPDGPALAEVGYTVDGAPIVTGGGDVSVHSLPSGTRVRLEAADLDVSHLFGAAIGSAIANAGSNRAIDTDTVVSIDLGNASPDVLGSAMFRVENIGIESARMLVR